MSFSDWATIISILLAVLIAVFKYDEWEIIRLRRFEKYIWLPLILVFLSGLSAYFQTNLHPTWLDFLWINQGFQSGFWAIIWIFLFFVCGWICWIKFTNAKPSYELIKKYCDYLDTYEPSKFSSLFRKYERYFFRSEDENAWVHYQLILSNKKWWLIAPSHFREMVYRAPNRFYEMDFKVLKSLLFSQISNIPHSQITRELETQWNGNYLSEKTPILNIFLSRPYYIEKSRERNILLPLIKEVAEEYFSSIQFSEGDKPIFLLKPSGNSYNQVAPKSLIPFYFIQIIDCYWHQVFTTKAQVSGFFFYSAWTAIFLEVAPEISDNKKSETLPNLYICAVERMLSNINGWIGFNKGENYSEFGWATVHFTELKRWILFIIQDKHLNKVPQEWFLNEIKHSFKELIDCRNAYNEAFVPNFNGRTLNPFFINTAFNALTNEDYCRYDEQQDPGYLWLKSIIC